MNSWIEGHRRGQIRLEGAHKEDKVRGPGSIVSF